MSADIQQARGLLAQWRGAWPFGSSDEVIAALRTAEVGNGHRAGWYSEDRLILGIAGNPDLLDVISLFLDECGRSLRFWERLDLMPGDQRVAVTFALNMSAAIIAADERMNA